jgi:hypothetical protein
MRSLLVAGLMLSSYSFADEVYVTGSPTEGEVGRYVLYRAGEATVKLDTRTSAAWQLCSRKNLQAWCRIKDIPSAPTGPSGRYRLSEGSLLMLVDSVSGRTWMRCDLPTPEKGSAWCPVSE